MAVSQVPANASASGSGRVAQRRRTRAAIVDATTRLIGEGRDPSVDEIAAAADVSRRTVYLYFPTLDQLLLDATLGALTASQARPVPGTGEEPGDAVARVDRLVRSLVGGADTTLPLGRRIIALTVEASGERGPSADGDTPRRGYRRITWIEDALRPLREDLTPEQFSRLVSALSIVIGFEAMVVLRDVGALSADREEEVLRWTASTLVRAMLAEAVSAELR